MERVSCFLVELYRSRYFDRSLNSSKYPRDILHKPASRILDVRQRRISNIAIKGKYKEQKNKLQYRFTSVKNE